MVQPICLDYNGTTLHDLDVIAAMRPFLEIEFGNPSSSHWNGIRPKKAVKGARRQVAGFKGKLTTAEDIDRAIAVIVGEVNRLQRQRS